MSSLEQAPKTKGLLGNNLDYLATSTKNIKPLPFQIQYVKIPIPDKLDPSHAPVSSADDLIHLHGKVWIPEGNQKITKFPVIVEFSAARCMDVTIARDSVNYEGLAKRGIVGLRVDLRGSGNSESVGRDEYLFDEQVDCYNVLQWIIKQSWSSGHVFFCGGKAILGS